MSADNQLETHLIKLLNDLKTEDKEKPFGQSLNQDTLNQTQECLSKICGSTGLNESNLHEAIKIILDINRLSDNRFTRLLYSCIPSHSIARNTLDYIFAKCWLWNCQVDREKLMQKCNTCLYYFVGLLKYKIILPEEVKGHYMLYFSFLKNPKLQVVAAELIYFTTNYNNLIQICATNVDVVHSQLTNNNSSKHLRALFSLFNRLKADIITPLNILEVNDECQCFPKMNDILKKHLTAYIHRLHLSFKKSIAHPNAHLNQIGLRSKGYSRYQRAFLQFEDLTDFLEFYLKGGYDMYSTNYDSLIGNKYNFLLLAITQDFAPVQHYFHFVFANILNGELEMDETKKILTGVANINHIFGDDIFGVRLYLKYFLQNHDPCNYLSEILMLFQTMRYESFESFYNEILSKLYVIFVNFATHRHLNGLCQIINALKQFIYNCIEYNSRNFTAHLIFPESKERSYSMSETDLSLVIEATQHLCKLLLNVFPGNFKAMLTVIQYYETLHALETIKSVNVLSMVPSEIVIAFLVNPNLIVLDRLCKLIIDSLELADVRKCDSTHLGRVSIDKNAKELYYFFWRNPLNTSLTKNVIVCNGKLKQKLNELKNISKIYFLKNNHGFWHITHLNTNKELIEGGEINLKKLNTAAPNLLRLLSRVRTSQK